MIQDLHTNTLIWTLELSQGSMTTSEGNASDMQVSMSPGSSMYVSLTFFANQSVWVATEMRGEDEGKTAPTTVYFIGNFTFNTQERIDIE